MPRRAPAQHRPVAPDAKYNNRVVTQLINKIMLSGKKSLAVRIVYDAFDIVAEKTGEKPLDVFKQAMDNVKPQLECKPKRVGGATYQVPTEIREPRREALAMRWIIAAARGRSGKSMSEKLAAEMLDAYANTGSAFKKKEDMHRMAEANKAFSHIRF